MLTPDSNWLIERLEVGELLVNCYLAGWRATSEAVVIDPGGEVERILDRIGELGLKVTAIVNTHCHGDHIGGNGELMEATGAPLWVGVNEAPLLTDPWKNMSAPFGMDTTSPPADRLLREGDVVQVGGGSLKVFDAPGHSPGSIILAGDGFAFVGDVLFQGSIGRTDFPGGSLEMLLDNIRRKIYPLGDDCIIYPGHGQESTVGIERRSNPFLNIPPDRLRDFI